MKYSIILILLAIQLSSNAQSTRLFNNPDLLHLVDQVANHLYNERFDSATFFIDSLETTLAKHPLIPMMRAMTLAWQDMPFVSSSPHYEEHIEALQNTIVLSDQLMEQEPDNIEGLFFAMSAHGLLAQYFADQSSYMKALSEATKTYEYLKKIKDRTNESPELCFLAGLYNYFRVTYPQRHVVYKPFLWAFYVGNRERGLIQLDSAVYFSKIVAVEAHMYSAKIYMDYENDPKKAMTYIERLRNKYPFNSYFKAKFVDASFLLGRYDEMLLLIPELQNHDKVYYQLCAETHLGLYAEKVELNYSKARLHYQKAHALGQQCELQGEDYITTVNHSLDRLRKLMN